jgi:hypothetical protein
MVLACGGGDDISQIDACKEAQSIACDKLFNCLDKTLLEALKMQIGLNAADCKVKFQASECNADKAKCDAGKSYNAGNAQMCLSGLRQLSCNDITRDISNIPEPAVCALICN